MQPSRLGCGAVDKPSAAGAAALRQYASATSTVVDTVLGNVTAQQCKAGDGDPQRRNYDRWNRECSDPR